jgi:phage-related protein
MKDIIFAGNSLEAIRCFPQSAKREAGYQLDKIQHNEDPDDWKPMSTIATSVREIRIRDSDGIFRVIYIAKFEEAVYVLHAFQKKTQKTSKQDLEAAKRAYKQVLESRNS